jgi:protein gp37
MARYTNIEYCHSTVNPVVGCTGCELYSDDPNKNICYAKVLVDRYSGRKGWPDNFTDPQYYPQRLEKAIRWREPKSKEVTDKPWLKFMPRIIFVNDLSDGFAPDIDPNRWLKPYISGMEASGHKWLLLTKWPSRMKRFVLEQEPAPRSFIYGTSVLRQNQHYRLRQLLTLGMYVPDINLWLSIEPILEHISLKNLFQDAMDTTPEEYMDFLHRHDSSLAIMIGGQSGQGKPTMTPSGMINAIHPLVIECKLYDIPVFVKQINKETPVPPSMDYKQLPEEWGR